MEMHVPSMHPPERGPGRASAIAAVAAVLGMAVTMVALYSCYIRHIHDKQARVGVVPDVYLVDGVPPAPPPFAIPGTYAAPPERTFVGHAERMHDQLAELKDRHPAHLRNRADVDLP
jgi:hypothetical protein